MLLALILACATSEKAPPPPDADGDGVTDAEDCAPADTTVHPGAADHCDHRDDDCDGQVDEDGPFYTWYADLDGDGFGDPDAPVTTCFQPAQTATNATDCGPADPARYPGADETCNGIDDDCDGLLDESPGTVWCQDVDGDAHADPEVCVQQCDPPDATWITVADDCDDTRADVHPGALEVCDAAETDEDCDGRSEEDGASGGMVFYLDWDGDGYGGPDISRWGCAIASGEAPDHDDCDDYDRGRHPDADEYCDHEDDDCDGLVDEDAVDVKVNYRDVDRDGYGDPAATIVACHWIRGQARTGTDCDDTDRDTHPGAPEDDCDDPVDHNCDGGAAYDDRDGDGVPACEDCNDADAGVSPDADEVCAAGDQNCDGDEDADAVDARTWYGDADNDGYGDVSVTTLACDEPADYASRGTDCDDTSAAISPADPERCSTPGVDDDCDGVEDEDGATDCTRFYVDADGDGYGESGLSMCGCEPDAVWSTSVGGDCDDADDTISPAAEDATADGIDWDCDGFDCSFHGGVISLQLEDNGAAAPPLSATAAGTGTTAWIGDRAYLSEAGDQVGRALLLSEVPGALSGDDAAASVLGDVSRADFGSTVFAGFDVDGDGVGDLLVSAPDSSVRDRGAGSVFLVTGVTSGTNLLADLTAASWDGQGRSDGLDQAAYAGDPDADGVADILLGVAATNYGYGAAHLHAWNVGSGVPVEDGWASVVGVRSSDQVGAALLGAVDLDGDGLDDAVVGAPGYEEGTTNEGGAAVLLGPASGTVAFNTTPRWSSGAPAAEGGACLADAGDQTGDGLPDLWIGAPGYGADDGKVYLVAPTGSGSSLTLTTVAVWESVETGARFGAALASGDLDGDGAADLIVGAAQASAGDDGAVYVFLAPGTGSGDTDDAALVVGGGPGIGTHVVLTPDANGDGNPELGSSDNAGGVYLIDPW